MEQRTPSYESLAFELIRLIDRGHSASIAEVRRRIDTGSLFDLFTGLGADPSLYGTAGQAAVVDRFKLMTHEIDHEYEYDVTRNGLALCLAYCVQAMAAERSRVSASA